MPTASRAAPPGGRRLSPGRASSAPGSARSAIPGVAASACKPRIRPSPSCSSHGYATGQFGKNHLGDRNEFLPTVHGFDEFFGNLYHLNAEEEPEDPTTRRSRTSRIPRALRPARRAATAGRPSKDDPREHPRWGRVGKQRIEDTGPLTRKRMETCDDEFVEAACDFIRAPAQAAQAVLLLGEHDAHAPSDPHQARSLGQAGRWQSPYHDTMIDHDKHVGQLLDLLDELGIADDTIVMYATDNGPHMNTLARRGDDALPQREEHELGGRVPVPLLLRWPGKIPAGVVSNEIVQHHDWLPTFLAAAGEPDVVEKLKAGPRGGRQDVQGAHRRLQPAAVPHRRGRQEPAPGLHLLLRRRRPRRRCASTTGRSSSWSSGRPGRSQLWAEPFVPLRVPKLFNLRTDPFERADMTSNTY